MGFWRELGSEVKRKVEPIYEGLGNKDLRRSLLLFNGAVIIILMDFHASELIIVLTIQEGA